MTQFTFSAEHPSQQYIQITAQIPTTGTMTKVVLPGWRPGRYEMANFAKNIKNFVVFNDRMERLAFEQVSTRRSPHKSSGFNSECQVKMMTKKKKLFLCYSR